jgi:hypothetical protein
MVLWPIMTFLIAWKDCIRNLRLQQVHWFKFSTFSRSRHMSKINMHTFKCEILGVTQDAFQHNLLHKIVYQDNYWRHTFLHQWIVQFSKNCMEIWKITFYTYQSLKLSSKLGSLVERSPFCTQPPGRWYILQLPLNASEKRKPCVIYKHMRVIPIILWAP